VGSTGPMGPSDAFFAAEDSIAIPPGATATVVTLELPAGSYVIQGKVIHDSAFYGCNLLRSGDEVALDSASEQAGNSSPRGTLPLMAAATLAAPETLSIECGASSSSTTVSQVKLAAIKVGSLTL
jgi:hypothetical protein